MRLRPDLPRLLVLVLLAAAIPAVSAPTAATAPTSKDVDRAIEAVKADPNLATQKTIRRLVWDSKEEKKRDEPRKPSGWPKWLRWIGDFFGWVAQTSQMLFWLLIAALAAVLVVFLLRLFTTRVQRGQVRRFVAPTHVQDLDIRPESLPDDIGATARQLWERGDSRAALALLYRGLLSRLAHVYEVPIRDSSTEGDCLLLAGRVLEARRTEYATRLVRTWQRAIYGGLSIEAAVVYALCDEFDRHLDRPVSTNAPRRETYSRGAAA